MKLLMMAAGAVLICSTAAVAQSEQGVPSRARLAEMGLAGMVILSDKQAQSIRVRGRRHNPWGSLYPYVNGLSRLDSESRRPAALRVFVR